MKTYQWLLLIVILLLMPLGCRRQKPAPEFTFPDAEYAVNASDMAVVGDQIYYISGGKVYETASDTPVFEEFPASHIAAAGDGLAVFGGGIVRIGGESCTLPVAEITSLVCTDGTIGYTFRENGLEMPGFYNRKNGGSISVKPLLPGEVRMLPFQEERILIQCTDTVEGGSLLYDFSTQTMKPGSVMLEADMITVSAYNAADNAIYMLDGSAGGEHLTRYDVETGESTAVIPADALRMNLLDLTFSGGSAIFRKMSGGISVLREYTAAEEADSVVRMLVLSGRNDYDLKRLSYILKRDCGITLEVTKIAEDKLRLKLLAGEDDFDLFVADMQDGGSYLTNTLVLDYPIYEPLENFPQIMEQMDGLFDDVVRLCSHGGHIFGIPAQFMLSNSFLSYDADLLEELNLSLPEADWTLEDFYALAKEVRSDGVYIAFDAPLSLWDYMWSYFDPYGSGTLNDDGTALREYLTVTKKLRQEDLVYPGIYKELMEEQQNGTVRLLFDNGDAAFVWNRENVALPPSFTGERIYGVNIPFLMMNAHSQNKADAAVVIAEYLNPKNRILTMAQENYIYKDRGVYVHSAVYSVNFEETYDEADDERRAEMLREVEENRKEYMTNDLVNMDEKTAENFAMYLDYLKYAKLGPSYVDEWLKFAVEEAEKYWNDEQDLDYTAERILYRAKMILDE